MSSGPAEPRVVNDNGAWCWFQDERALVDPRTQTLVVGSIAAAEGPGGEARSGNVELSVVDLRTGASEVVVLHENLEVDDHDVPALWHRSDDRWLAVYTRHKSDDLTRWRISEPGDPTRWGPERTFDWSEFTGGRGVTYSNLRVMGGRLYCFARAVNDDQCALVSDDEGETWSYAGKLFTRPKVGYVNGYTRYAAREGRIDLVTTDHHPRDFDNSIYHGYLEDGALHRSDGSVLDPKALNSARDDAEAPSQEDLTTVLAAGSRWGGVRMSHCWTTDIRTGANGAVAAILTARAGEEERNLGRKQAAPDLRFFYGRMAPSGAWTVNELAKAGPGLMPHEEDYTGLAAIDPYDLGSVYISTSVDPRDGSVLAHREIFHGRAAAAGTFWAWTPITENSEVDNLRPIVAPGDRSRTPLLWFRGPMTASQHYRCEIVLLDLPCA